MKTSRFTDSQILAVLKQAESGSPVPELCREYGISSADLADLRETSDLRVSTPKSITFLLPFRLPL